MSEIRTGHVAKYMLLPSVVPRFRLLVGSGFGHIAFFVALLFRSVGLLPVGHPYLVGSNVGRFGLLHVIAEAANRLEFRRDNLDQILIFSVIMIGVVVLAVQLFVMLVGMFMPVASAQTILSDPRSQAQYANDITFILLDKVFGVPGIFNSCVSTSEVCTTLQLSFVDSTNNPITAATLNDAKILYSNSDVGTAIPMLANTTTLGENYAFYYYRVGYAEDTANPLPTPLTFPTNFHVALHGLFRLYSMALLVIAMIIFLYFVVAIVMETAQTGTPFGRRFNGVWAPIRLVVAIGLLVPIMGTGGGASGLNAAQYIVLHAAKYGSVFASNGWFMFMETLYTVSGGTSTDNNDPSVVQPTATVLGDKDELVSVPKSADIRHLIEFNMLAKTCYYIYMCDPALYSEVDPTSGEKILYCPWVTDDSGNAIAGIEDSSGNPYNPWIRGGNSHCPAHPGEPDPGAISLFEQADRRCAVQPYLVRSGGDSSLNYMPFIHTDYDNNSAAVDTAMEFYNGGDVLVRYGVRDPQRTDNKSGNTSWEGFVSNECGELLLPTNDLAEPGAKYLRMRYYNLLREMWMAHRQSGWFRSKANGGLRDIPMDDFAKRYVYQKYFKDNDDDTSLVEPATAEEKQDIVRHWAAYYQMSAENAQVVQINASYFSLPEIVRERGWAGAGVWYNRLAEMNGTLVTAARQVGVIKSYPSVMEKVHKKRAEMEESVAYLDRYNPTGSKGAVMVDAQYNKAASIMHAVYGDWNKKALAGQTAKQETSNMVRDVISALFGLSGLFDMRENAEIHPLAQLVSVGKSLVESSILFMGVSLVGFIPMQGISELGGIAISLATVGLTAGFVLYYVLPFLPFLYFFFAVGGWIKAIFEAMVGVPLWALAHLRIDGDGLPGEAGMAGYMLIFEIFLRPIMILFGLLASVTIFAAMVFVLNDVFRLVTENLAGYDFENVKDQVAQQASDGTIQMNANAAVSAMSSIRGEVDQFFFTIIYAIIVYMIGMSCFKLVDLIPNQILRWMGQSVSAFGEGQNDAAGQLTQYAAFGGMQVVGKLGGAMQGMQGAAQNAVKASKAQGDG